MQNMCEKAFGISLCAVLSKKKHMLRPEQHRTGRRENMQDRQIFLANKELYDKFKLSMNSESTIGH